MTTAGLRPRARTFAPFVLLCFVLQMPVVALGPVLAVISRDAGLTLAQAGALTSIPVLCLALLTPVAAHAVAATGVNRALVLAAGVIGTGILVRSQGSLAGLYLGSVVIGSGIALANIAVPTLITRRYQHRALMLSGLQTSATNLGSALSAALSAPLVAALGWQRGLAVWAVVAFAAAGVWWWRHGLHDEATTVVGPARSAEDDHTGHGIVDVAEAVAEARHTVPPRDARSVPGWRVPLAWVLGLALVMHGTCYYAVSSWLALVLQERSGLTQSAAGACVSVFMALGIVGPLLLSVLLRLPRVRLWMLLVLTSAGWLACTLLLATVPAWWPAAVVVGGLVQGASFTVIVTFGVHVAADESQSRGIQATLQTVGFTGAAVGPVLIGAVRDATDGWTVALSVLVAVATLLLAIGGVASRMLVLHDRRSATP